MKKNRSMTNFIIACAPRTGSTMLRIMLDSHPDIRCLGEKFVAGANFAVQNISGEKTQAPARPAEDPIAYLHDVVWNGESCMACGCKIKYRQLEEQFPVVLESVLNNRDIKIIHLRRENLVKRYVSNRLAGKKLTPNVIRLNDKTEPVDQPKISIDYQQCIEDIHAVQAAEKRFRDYFWKHPVFELTYEELVQEKSTAIYRLQEFLMVEPRNLLPETVKINSNRLEEIIENYDELLCHLKDTPYSKFL